MTTTCLREDLTEFTDPEIVTATGKQSKEGLVAAPFLETVRKWRPLREGGCFKIASMTVGLILLLVLTIALTSNQDGTNIQTNARDLTLPPKATTHGGPRTSDLVAPKKPTGTRDLKPGSKPVAHPRVASIDTAHRKSVTWVPAINRDFPDSSVIYADNVYYAYSTQVYLDNVPFRTSIDGVHWSTDVGNAMPKLPSWASFGYTWAPTVTNAGDDHYVMFFVARDAASGAQCIGKAESSSPSGPFIDTAVSPFICDPSAGGDIDPHIFSDPDTGQRYLNWKLNGNAVGQPTSLWAAPLDSGFDLVGSPRELLTR